MRTPTLLFALSVLSLASCGGEEAAQSSWADAMTALEAGDSAMASEDFATAREAFTFAASQSDNAKVQAAATEKLIRACAQANDTLAALGALDTLKSSHGEVLDAAKLNELSEFMVTVAKNPELCMALVDTAEELGIDGYRADHYRQTIEAMRSGDADALAKLGYVGD